jgi:hypothetical protein
LSRYGEAGFVVGAHDDLADVRFVNWMSSDDAFALGRLGDRTVILVGTLGDGAVVDGSFPSYSSAAFTPALSSSDTAYVVAAPRDATEPHRFTIAFGRPILDPVLHMHSCGSTLVFTGGGALERVSGDDHFVVSGMTVSGGVVGGPDSDGTVCLRGSTSRVTFEARNNSVGGSGIDGIYLHVGGHFDRVSAR